MVISFRLHPLRDKKLIDALKRLHRGSVSRICRAALRAYFATRGGNGS